MRLLHTRTLELKEFFGKDIPLYAILSHTWEDNQEVTFQEFLYPTEEIKQKRGYTKIVKACRLSETYGFQYVWIDTCCINKDSSAELSEAINSMYQYYRNSVVCYAYLEDVWSDEDPRKEGSRFRCSKWFTRGWTLQELLAPSRLVFFAADWVDIGTKSSLEDIIQAETGIPSTVLHSLSKLQDISVAQKMSWAAKRATTREEDLAYCLMGIVGVNMPTLYGEGGARAFIRLQEEIIKRSADQSIFAWKAQNGEETSRGLLARSPAEFLSSGRVRASGGRDITTYSMTNRGLCIKLPLIPLDDQLAVCLEGQLEDRNLSFAIFDCQLEGRDQDQALGIFLERVSDANQFVRVKPDQIVLGHRWSTVSYLKQEIYVMEPDIVISQIVKPFRRSFWTVVTTSGNIRNVPRPDMLASPTGNANAVQTDDRSDYAIVETFPEFESIKWMSPLDIELEMKDAQKSSRESIISGLVLRGREIGMIKVQSTQHEESFVVVFGRNERIWADILTPEEWQLFRADSRQISMAQNVDRVGKSLKVTKRTSVSVALKKFHNSNQFLVEVDIREKMTIPYITTRLPPPLEYGFSVTIEADPELRVGIWATTFPADIWNPSKEKEAEVEAQPGLPSEVFLPIPSSREPGIVFFYDLTQSRKPLFAVMMGIRDFRALATFVYEMRLSSSDPDEWTSLCLRHWALATFDASAKSPLSPSLPASSSLSLDSLHPIRQVTINVKENTELDQYVTHRALIKINGV
ncbi:hypothetical protein D9758_007319 [Tetrapyrgos nigripes]|uniref:Heterokaryon incompatibility domain-containing protein n=1 Tax=Tetrapyrgos nigripes TaxID=182062 RepID=A0A8H5GB62_9AGAR|nr:hypothetical protein D9758_007319 [Tetrapyrgos nigripes]